MNSVYFAWENGDSRRDRVLHIFSDHDEFVKFWMLTDGLREWCAGARYPARPSEVENHGGNIH